ncbi:hypothetical protein DFJ67_2321 [Asanoa ferruginea]|uniref:Uncharacterized protein n=1 Tax=Asanoa ferruginea TaxID=53367 RepID=A0A3D9ZIJ8_9ACTN|nr:hypothetical protein DFJ67_2321 [Asanoa ferruginea]
MRARLSLAGPIALSLAVRGGRALKPPAPKPMRLSPSSRRLLARARAVRLRRVRIPPQPRRLRVRLLGLSQPRRCRARPSAVPGVAARLHRSAWTRLPSVRLPLLPARLCGRLRRDRQAHRASPVRVRRRTAATRSRPGSALPRHAPRRSRRGLNPTSVPHPRRLRQPVAMPARPEAGAGLNRKPDPRFRRMPSVRSWRHLPVPARPDRLCGRLPRRPSARSRPSLLVRADRGRLRCYRMPRYPKAAALPPQAASGGVRRGRLRCCRTPLWAAPTQPPQVVADDPHHRRLRHGRTPPRRAATILPQSGGSDLLRDPRFRRMPLRSEETCPPPLVLRAGPPRARLGRLTVINQLAPVDRGDLRRPAWGHRRRLRWPRRTFRFRLVGRVELHRELGQGRL